MIALSGESYLGYFSEFQFSMPRYVLIVLFCAAGMILYPVFIFENKKIRIVGAVIGAVCVVVLSALCLLNPPVYSTDIMGNNEEHPFDDSYTVSLADTACGDVSIRYDEGMEDYFLHAEFRRSGDTVLTMTSPTGEKTEYDLHIERDKYEYTKRQTNK